jgi:hypothetical protein
MTITPRQEVISLLYDIGFYYIEDQILCYLETFVTELITRLVLSIDDILWCLNGWLRSLKVYSLRQVTAATPIFLHLVEIDNEVYFTTLTQDARQICTFSGDSLVETIAFSLLINHSCAPSD